MSLEQDEPMLSLEIVRKHSIARDIWRFELRDPAGGALPPFEGGASIAVQVPGGARRRYSLCGDPADTSRYVIAVKRDANGRGGSIAMADATREGDRIDVSAPKNDFPLDARAPSFILVAGGIGVTPMLSMMAQLRDEGLRTFRLIYLDRDPESTAFLDELSGAEWRDHVKIHHDHGDPARSLDLWPTFERPGKAHVYCCGPRALMDSVRDMTGHWPTGSIHFESFGVDSALRRQNRPFVVRLARSGGRHEVPADRSILDVLREAGIRVPSSCESGTCGSCRTRLCGGVAEHRDLVLEEGEKASQIMVCVSRAVDGELVLDL